MNFLSQTLELSGFGADCTYHFMNFWSQKLEPSGFGLSAFAILWIYSKFRSVGPLHWLHLPLYEFLISKVRTVGILHCACLLRTKFTHVVLYRQINTVCSETHIKYVNTTVLAERGFLKVLNLMVHKATTGLWMFTDNVLKLNTFTPSTEHKSLEPLHSFFLWFLCVRECLRNTFSSCSFLNYIRLRLLKISDITKMLCIYLGCRLFYMIVKLGRSY